MQVAARFVVPRAGDVVSGGVVAWDAGLLTSAVGHRPDGAGPVVDLGDAVVLPGLVNAHAHLELSGCRGLVPLGDGFFDWIPRLTRARRDVGSDALLAAVRAAIAETLAAGVVAIGDIVSVDACAEPLLRSGLRGVCFLETLGPSPERGAEAAAALPGRLADADAHADAMPVGISPHTPWTATRALFESARETGVGRRFAVHVAETVEERRFCLSGDGPIAELLAGFGLDPAALPPPGVSPVAFLDTLGLLGPGTVCIHANYLDDDDVQRLVAAQAPVAYCPRSHAFFGHGPHPVQRLRAAGVPVALGTDSLASNDSLSIRDEMAFVLETRQEIAPDAVLDMATRGGALALGTGSGVLEAGAPADLTVVAIPGGGGDPIERVVAGEGEVILTVAAGRVLYDPRGVLSL